LCEGGSGPNRDLDIHAGYCGAGALSFRRSLRGPLEVRNPAFLELGKLSRGLEPMQDRKPTCDPLLRRIADLRQPDEAGGEVALPNRMALSRAAYFTSRACELSSGAGGDSKPRSQMVLTRCIRAPCR
jgi:hypothetical protein